MESLLGELLGFLLELAGDLLVQILVELAVEALSGRLSFPQRVRPAVSALALVCGGAAAGLLSVWLLPNRLFASRAVLPGSSLLLAPLITGLAMHAIGKRLQGAGHPASKLATFWGGALFAFAMALVRRSLIGPPHQA
jgi:hypothetical protein